MIPLRLPSLFRRKAVDRGPLALPGFASVTVPSLRSETAHVTRGEGIAEGRGKLYNFVFRPRVALREMEHDKLETVNHCIREAAQQAATSRGLRTSLIERFLRTGEETWDGAGSGRFTLAQFNEDEVYTRATKTALRTLFRLLGDLLPAEAQVAPQVGPERFGRALVRW